MYVGLASQTPQLEACEHIEKQDENPGKPQIPDGVMMWGVTCKGTLSSLPAPGPSLDLGSHQLTLELHGLLGFVGSTWGHNCWPGPKTWLL